MKRSTGIIFGSTSHPGVPGRYQLERLLGQGTFAEVYLAFDILVERRVACKILHTRLTQGEQLELFREEVRISSSMMHPHIIVPYDFLEEYFLGEKIYCIVMEYFPLGSLRECHREGVKVPLSTVVYYIKQLALGLERVHQKGFVHRDIKPENILMKSNGQIVLSDFGIATLAQYAESFRSQKTVGTLYYAAPEQFSGKSSPATDQYALGILVYEWLTGIVPFDASTTIELVHKQCIEAPLPLRQYVPAISLQVEAVVLKALAKDPTDRYPTVATFAAALEAAAAIPGNGKML